jgi:RNA polymerase sigma factor (sigma-70 family)
MYNNELQKFNEFYTKEYKYLKSFAKSINPSSDYESLLHDCYLKCHDRIATNGYQGTEFLNFTRVTIMNTYKGNYKAQKKKQMIDIEDPDFYASVEEILANKEDLQQQDFEAQERNSYIVTMIYEYLDKYYDDKEKFVFKTYFLLKSKHLNYKQLSIACKMSISTVSIIIKRIKQDLRINLKSFILTNKKIMNPLAEEAKKILDNQTSGNFWNEYKDVYQKITGQPWHGCRCKKNQAITFLQDYYNKNHE